MMKIVIALAALAVAASAFEALEVQFVGADANKPLFEDAQYDFLFTAWKKQHHQYFSLPAVEKERFSIFKMNVDKVHRHNLSGQSWTMELNQFAHLTADEFKEQTKCYDSMSSYMAKAQNAGEPFKADPNVTIPSSVDWRTKGAVTPVKNQEQCGSCWAFSSTGSMEGAIFLADGTLTSLSEQQLVDCSGSFGNMGCNGGLMDNAFKYAEQNGLCTEADYPYKGADGTCQSSMCSASKGTKLSGYKDVTANDEDALAAAAANNPVSVAVEADKSVFQFYSGGVMTSTACGTNLDHGVLVAGYGTDNGQDYWLVKNSWGASWGDQGYIKIGRGMGGAQGLCGIAMQPSYPIA